LSSDTKIASTISNALKLRAPDHPKHLIHLNLRLRLPPDVAVVVLAVDDRKEFRGFGLRNTAKRTALIFHVEVAGSIPRVRTKRSRAFFNHVLNLPRVVIPPLQKVDPPIRNAVDEPMLLRDPARPAALQLSPQRLRLPDAAERIADDRFDQI